MLLSTGGAAQTANNSETICKGEALPEGYTIIGETTSKDCPNNAWVIKRRGNAPPRSSAPSGGNSSSGGNGPSGGKAPTRGNATPAGNATSSAARPPSGPATPQPAAPKVVPVPAAEVRKVDEARPPLPGRLEWQTLAPIGEEFSIMLPGKPTHETKPTPGGTFESYELATDLVHFFVISHSVNQADLTPEVKETLLKTFITIYKDSFLERLRERGVPAEMSFERDLSISGNPAQQYRVALGKIGGLVRFCIADQHIYIVQVLAVSRVETSSQATKFLDSFQLRKQ